MHLLIDALASLHQMDRNEILQDKTHPLRLRLLEERAVALQSRGAARQQRERTRAEATDSEDM